MIYAFWAILMGIIAIRLYWKHSTPSRHDNLREAFFGKRKKRELPISGNAGFKISPEMQKLHDKLKVDLAQKEIDDQKKRDIEDLRRQGYNDELIAVILPTINNGK